MSTQEVDLPLLWIQQLDQRVGQVLLGVGRDALDAAHVLDDDGAVGVDVVLLSSEPGPSVGVDVFDLHLFRVVRVALEPWPEAVEVRLPGRTP